MDLSRADKVNALRFVVGQHQYIAQGSQQGNPLEDELPGSQGSLPTQVAVRQHAEYTGSTAAILTVTATRAYAAPAVAGIEPLAEQLRTHSGTPLNTLWPQCESDACAWRSDENGMPQENGVYQIEIERLVHNEEKAAVLRVVRMKDGRVLLEIGPIRGGGKS